MYLYALETVILASAILYEIVGPACAKLSLYYSGAYSNKLEDLVPEEELTPADKPRSEVEMLIERIQKIQEKIPPAAALNEEIEEAFDEAAEEHYAATRPSMRHLHTHRK